MTATNFLGEAFNDRLTQAFDRTDSNRGEGEGFEPSMCSVYAGDAPTSARTGR